MLKKVIGKVLNLRDLAGQCAHWPARAGRSCR